MHHKKCKPHVHACLCNVCKEFIFGNQYKTVQEEIKVVRNFQFPIFTLLCMCIVHTHMVARNVVGACMLDFIYQKNISEYTRIFFKWLPPI